MDDLLLLPVAEWRAAMAEAEADYAAGRITDGQAVRERLRRSIEQMERNNAPVIAAQR